MHRYKVSPEYIWRPSQILRRLSFRSSENVIPLSLPWHCTINACPSDILGKAIATQGVYDLPLTEAIVRLTDAGDTVVDVGANIGYMALVLARSAGPRGRVLCFEPNEDVLPLMRENMNNWRSPRFAPIQLNAIALSDRDGAGSLGFPADYKGNRGVASLEAKDHTLPVIVRRLDSLETGPIGVMKLDVEGHEAAVLAGAEKLLAQKLIRDILFEEHQNYPVASHKILLNHGYCIFRVTRSTWRPMLLPPEAAPRQAYLPSNFLATVDPSRALLRFRAWGWRALSVRLER